MKKGSGSNKEGSRWQAGGPSHFPTFSTQKLRRTAAAGMGEANAMRLEVERMMRTKPEDRTAAVDRHVVTLDDVTRGLGIETADEQRLQRVVSDTLPTFTQKTQTQRIMHARGRLNHVLRDSMKHVDSDTRMEVQKRATAYWKRNYQTDYGRTPGVRHTRKSMGPKLVIAIDTLSKGGEPVSPATKKSLVIPRDVLEKAAARGGKYYKRVATGKPKRPWRYFYTQEQYEREHGADDGHGGHLPGGKTKKLRAIQKLKKQLARPGVKTKNALDEEVLASAADRLWVKAPDFGLPAQTIHAHAKDTGRKNQFGETIREYSASRKPLHSRLVQEATANVKRVPKGEKPVAIVMMGGGGSGKGTILKAIVHNHGDFVHVDPDAVKGELPEYKEAMHLTTIGDTPVTAKDAAWMAHEESSDVAEAILAKGIENRQNVIVDGTGKNAQKHADKISALKKAGYHVKLIYAHASMEESISRAAGRADRSGRYVPLAVLEDAHTKIPGNFEFVARHADEFALFESKRPPGVMWSHPPETIHEPDKVEAFKKLGKRLHKERGITLPPIPDHLQRKGAEDRLAASLSFWTDLSKASGPKANLSMVDVLKRVADNSKHYDLDTTHENATEGGEAILRAEAEKLRGGGQLHKSMFQLRTRPIRLEW